MGAFRLRWGVLTLLAGAGFFAGCGSNSNDYNPTPTITNIIPSTVTAGSQSFTMYVTGTQFIDGTGGASFLYWNNSPRSTVLNTNTEQLQVTIPASDLVNAGTAQITVSNPGPGGGTSSGVFFTIEPVQSGNPAISSMSPTSASTGGQGFTLTVNGANFTANDVVTWNSQFRTTTFVNATQVTAAIENTDIATSGFAAVSVVSSVNAVIASPMVDFSINGANNPTPSISSIFPPTISVSNGVNGVQVLVGGSNFAPNATVEWNGSPRATSYLKGSQLIAVLLPSDLASAGTDNISVSNPAPGGGVSGNATFTVTGN